MNTEHRYIFEKGSKKYHCPNCNKRRFVRYIDTQTGECLPNSYGRCDREIKCGYFLNPYKDGYAKAIREHEHGNKTDWKLQPPKRVNKPVNNPKRVFIPVEVFNRTHSGFEKNVFIQNLLTQVAFPFDVQDVEKVISMYHLGTVQNGYRAGAITFPFIDDKGNVRAIQVKQFDQQNHTTDTDFLHSIIKNRHNRNNKPLPEWLEAYYKNDTKVSCLFGEHLLSKYPDNPVALVEAPKTAIYGTLYFGFPKQPKDLLWLAVYSLSSLTLNKCQALKDRNVYLFPDLSKDGKAFELWSNKATQIQKGIKGAYFKASNLLEQLAPQQDKEQGKDLADYLIQLNWRFFREQDSEKLEPVVVNTSEERVASDESDAHKTTFFSTPDSSSTFEESRSASAIEVSLEQELVTHWDDEIEKLETYFSNRKLTPQPIPLNACSTILDVPQFVKSHLKIIKVHNGHATYRPYLDRLQELQNVLNQV